MADPFGAPPGAAANPFQGQQQPPDPYGAQGNNVNPFAAPPTPQQQQPFGYPQQQQQQPASPYQQPMQQGQPAQPSPQQQSYDPFSQAPPQQMQLQPSPAQAPAAGQYNNALVPTQQPANPYAGLVAPAPPAAPASYDPFAGPPPSSQALVPVAPNEVNPFPGAPPYQQQQQQFQQQPPPQQYQQQQQQQPPPQQPPPQPPGPPPHETPIPPPVTEVAMVPAPSSGYPGAPPSTPRGSRTNDEAVTPSGAQARNKYSAPLAQNAPLGASPLPRADMVKKTGYVLSRISFRTIVMKKWKQSFWVQYGPHTMLWFRSQSDFDDWLNNPYHSQAQRNFLIKLAVNFAHDLYKPNVRGYQVTQCRTKSYGTKLIRQFKLERWMDYGPTIAAAFGSNNPKEVDDLREALVACMRNTPLNGGIRATGAVRQGSGPPQGYNGQGEIPSTPDGGYANRSAGSASELRNDQQAFDDTASTPPPAAAPDLLDFSEPVQTQPPQHQTSFHSQPAYAAQSPPTQQQNQYPPGTPQSQPQYGAPPPPQQQQYQGAPPGQYPVQQQQQPLGAQPPIQQQYPPQGQPQAYGGY